MPRRSDIGEHSNGVDAAAYTRFDASVLPPSEDAPRVKQRRSGRAFALAMAGARARADPRLEKIQRKYSALQIGDRHITRRPATG